MPDGAARLDHELQALEGEAHRVDDLLVGDGDDLVDEPARDLPRERAGRVRLQPVGDRARHVDLDRLPRLRTTATQSSPAAGSTPTTRVTPSVLRDRRAAGDQAAAADRDDERVDEAGVLDQLERRRALARP